MMPLQSKLNPLAPEFRPSTLTTTAHHSPPPNHHLYYYDRFPPLSFFLPHNLYNPPPAAATTTPPPPFFLPPSNYYYVTTSTSHGITPCPPSSSPLPPATTEQTSEQQTRLDTTVRTRGGYRRRRDCRRGGFVPLRVRQQWRSAPATVSTVKGNGGGSSGRDRETRRVRGIVRDGKEVLKLEPDDSSTTVMIKNIPSRYTRELLMEFLDKHCMTMNDEAGSDSTEKFIYAYDFLYLPVDFEKKANKGYAFVNFTDPKAAWRFFETSNGQSWDRFHSSKVRQIVSARLQGKERLVKHFRGSAFRCESDDYLPMCFSPARDGSAGQEVKQTTEGNRVW